jgi:hypothetical protein
VVRSDQPSKCVAGLPESKGLHVDTQLARRNPFKERRRSLASRLFAAQHVQWQKRDIALNEGSDIERQVRAGEIANQNRSASGRYTRQHRGQDPTAHGVDQQIGLQLLRTDRIVTVDDNRAHPIDEQRSTLRAAHDGGHLRPGLESELARQRADGTGRACYDDALAVSEFADVVECDPRGRAWREEGGADVKIDIVRQGSDCTVRRGDHLGPRPIDGYAEPAAP